MDPGRSDGHATAIPAAGPGWRSNRRLQLVVALYCVLWLWAAVAPVYRFDWFLENILTVLFASCLLLSYRRFRFSYLSYGLIFLFMALHAVGGHYTYSEVPFGFWLADAFGFARNHYDRIVHFAFGLLLAYPMREVVLRLGRPRPPFAAISALSMVFAGSASFEIIEWIIAIIVDPQAGAAYLGTQGDEFDSQKDMALAALGGAIALGLAEALERRR